MKILGISEIPSPSGYGTQEAYIVQITRTELMKVANKASYRDDDAFPRLKAGQEYQIAEGYDFRGEIVQACKAMVEAHEKFAQATQTMTRFVRLLPSDVLNTSTQEESHE